MTVQTAETNQPWLSRAQRPRIGSAVPEAWVASASPTPLLEMPQATSGPVDAWSYRRRNYSIHSKKIKISFIVHQMYIQIVFSMGISVLPCFVQRFAWSAAIGCKILITVCRLSFTLGNPFSEWSVEGKVEMLESND